MSADRHITLSYPSDPRFDVIPAGRPLPVVYRGGQFDAYPGEPMIRTRAYGEHWAPIYIPVLARENWPAIGLPLACCGR